MFWGTVAVLSENFYEQWHLNKLKRLREIAHEEQMSNKAVFSSRI
jgi:hypothetical protein